MSGRVAVYRLGKYRVDKVCKGKYDGSEIVVDHLVFTGKEFDGIKVNARVCVTAKITNKILARWNSEGIRSPSDDVKIFYEAHEDKNHQNWADMLRQLVMHVTSSPAGLARRFSIQYNLS